MLEEELGRLSRASARGSARPAAAGVRVMYDHLLPTHRAPFAEWAACRRVALVHVVRRAVVESYWSLQARGADFLGGGGTYVDDTADAAVAAHLATNRGGLRLDARAAGAYVREVPRTAALRASCCTSCRAFSRRTTPGASPGLSRRSLGR
jgi:hypothetical protein